MYLCLQYIFGPSVSHSIQDASPEEAFWHVVPGLCDLQASLTCLPFATRPADALQAVIAAHGPRTSARHKPLYNEALSGAVQAMRRFGIEKLPSIMPMTHSHFVNYGGNVTTEYFFTMIPLH